ncbi:MAG: hypothetical protein WC943_16605, partial [Elusimicrobiota bacterium]
MRRVTASLVCACMLHGAVWSPMPASASVSSEERSSADPVEDLTEALESALSQGADADSLALAVQGLENDALDSGASNSRAEASQVLLRTISSPKLIPGLRDFLRRHAGSPSSS